MLLSIQEWQISVLGIESSNHDYRVKKAFFTLFRLTYFPAIPVHVISYKKNKQDHVYLLDQLHSQIMHVLSLSSQKTYRNVWATHSAILYVSLPLLRTDDTNGLSSILQACTVNEALFIT